MPSTASPPVSPPALKRGWSRKGSRSNSQTALHFGDLGDPDSRVSHMVAERRGVDLMPELGYAPVNRYLPPRPRRDLAGTGPLALTSTGGAAGGAAGATNGEDGAPEGGGLAQWIDTLLSR